MFGLRTDVKKRGPWFDARAGHILRKFADDAEKEIADEANERVHQRMHVHFRHPTGRYESHVRVRTRGPFHEVSDGGVVYGPWLEGVGSRNFPRTRFKGYRIFRKVGNQIERKADNIAERLLRAKYLWRLR